MEELTHHPPINKNCQEQSGSGVLGERSESPPKNPDRHQMSSLKHPVGYYRGTWGWLVFVTTVNSTVKVEDDSVNPSDNPIDDSRPEMEFKELELRFKSAKTRFKLSAGLNFETFDTILSGTNHI